MHLVLKRGLLGPCNFSFMFVLSLIKVLDLPQITAIDHSVNLPFFNGLIRLFCILDLLSENSAC